MNNLFTRILGIVLLFAGMQLHAQTLSNNSEFTIQDTKPDADKHTGF